MHLGQNDNYGLLEKSDDQIEGKTTQQPEKNP